MGKLVGVLFGFSFLALLFTLLPFTIALPGELLAFFTGNSVRDFFSSLYYFLPLDYLFACILIVYSARYFKIIFKMISWLYHKIFV